MVTRFVLNTQTLAAPPGSCPDKYYLNGTGYVGLPPFDWELVLTEETYTLTIPPGSPQQLDVVLLKAGEEFLDSDLLLRADEQDAVRLLLDLKTQPQTPLILFALIQGQEQVMRLHPTTGQLAFMDLEQTNSSWNSAVWNFWWGQPACLFSGAPAHAPALALGSSGNTNDFCNYPLICIEGNDPLPITGPAAPGGEATRTRIPFNPTTETCDLGFTPEIVNGEVISWTQNKNLSAPIEISVQLKVMATNLTPNQASVSLVFAWDSVEHSGWTQTQSFLMEPNETKEITYQRTVSLRPGAKIFFFTLESNSELSWTLGERHLSIRLVSIL